jgi:hypothetical protein
MADGSAKAKIECAIHAHIEQALAAAQGEYPEIAKGRTAEAGKFSYDYADISDILTAMRPVLAKHGLSISQPTRIQGDALVVSTQLRFRPPSGDAEIIESEYPVCKASGAHQEMGKALTYARRYALCSLLGVAPAREDEDGQGAAKAAAPERRQEAPAQKVTPPEPKRDLTPAERMKNFKIKLSQVKTSDEAIVLWESPRAEELRAALTNEQRAELADYYGQVCSREGAFA